MTTPEPPDGNPERPPAPAGSEHPAESTAPEESVTPAATAAFAAPGVPTPTRSRWRRRPGPRGLLIGAGALVLVLLAGGVGFGIGRHSGYGHGSGHRGHHGGPGHSAMERGGFGEPGGLGMGPDGGFGGPGMGPDGGSGRGERGMANTVTLAGSVVSVAEGSLVVAPDGGAPQVTVPTTDRTRVRGAGNGLTGLQPAQRVVVRIGGDKSAVAVFSPQATAVGTITALNGDRAVLVRPDGLTEAVDLAAANPKPANGDLVAVSGVAVDNGATLKVATLRVLPKAS